MQQYEIADIFLTLTPIFGKRAFLKGFFLYILILLNTCMHKLCHNLWAADIQSNLVGTEKPNNWIQSGHWQQQQQQHYCAIVSSIQVVSR